MKIQIPSGPQNNGCALIINDDGVLIASGHMRYTVPDIKPGNYPRPLVVEWDMEPRGYREKPGRPGHYTVEIDGHGLPRETVAQNIGVTPSLLRAAEQIMFHNAGVACDMSAARIEQGRRDWANMSREERDALNAYALQVEGHAID